jgi:hypothetical protein
MESKVHCSNPDCRILLGVVRGNYLHIKYKQLRLATRGPTRVYCRRCGALTEWMEMTETTAAGR